MQDVNIPLEREYIYQYVTTLTGNLGRQRGEYDKYVCLPDNYPALDRFFDTAIAVVEASIWRRLSSTYGTTLQYNKGTLTVHIKADSLPPQLTGALETNTRLAIAYILAGMWLQGIDPSLYAHYSQVADKYINSILEIASQKDFASMEYQQQGADSVPVGSPNGTTGTADTNADDVPVDSPNGPTGTADTNKDDVPVAASPKMSIGDHAIRDCCINRHSELDDAILGPDGTVMFYRQ